MTPLERHIAGATVTHNSPFAGLQVPVSHQLPPVDILETWVLPLYFGLHQPQAKEFVSGQLHLVSDELVAQLLASFNWRPRTAAAYLAALSERQNFTTQIGRLLLRSDVCFAGSAYCVALAEFNTQESVGFLDEYLTYYLTRHDLWFDQGDAIAAMMHLDRLNDTENAARHIGAWGAFVENKPNWSLASSVARFEKRMTDLHEAKRLGARP